jgi:membrane protease YdiL (CAAX protease family)
VAASSTWAALTGSHRLTVGLVVSGLLGLWAAYLSAMALVIRWKGSGHVAADLALRADPRTDVALGAAAGLLTALVVVPGLYRLIEATGVLSGDLPARLSAPAERLAHAARSGPAFILLALAVGVGAPIVEESFFRGFLQPAAVRRFGAAGGIALTALFFGLAHGEPLAVPGLTAFGAVVGVLAHRTGRLGPGIAAHIAFNALTLVRLAGLR